VTSPSNHILVDANIAKSAKDPARHPTSSACLRLARLLESRKCATGAAFTPALRAEWRRHASPTMTSWLAGMETRGRVRREKDAPVRDLRGAVAKVDDSNVRAALEKDLHLSEAAILRGLPVASQDDQQRKFLARLAGEYGLAGQVQWLNPVTEAPEEWEKWIMEGCPDRTVFTCCAAVPRSGTA
jgi:hypothetical protein